MFSYLQNNTRTCTISTYFDPHKLSFIFWDMTTNECRDLLRGHRHCVLNISYFWYHNENKRFENSIRLITHQCRTSDEAFGKDGSAMQLSSIFYFFSVNELHFSHGISSGDFAVNCTFPACWHKRLNKHCCNQTFLFLAHKENSLFNNQFFR